MKSYTKLWHDSEIKAIERRVELSVAVVTKATNDPFDHWNVRGDYNINKSNLNFKIT